MGYSHSWGRPSIIGKHIWKKIINDFSTILPHLGIRLRGHDLKPGPTITDELVEFTNFYPYGRDRKFYPYHFYFPRRFSRDRDPGGCKTHYLQYDLAVMVFLIIAKHYLKERLRVYSDGSIENWYPAVEKCLKVLGYGLEEVKQMKLSDYLLVCEGLLWWEYHTVADKKIRELLSKLENISKEKSK